MTKRLKTNVHVFGEQEDLVLQAGTPESDVPDWAKERIGDHVYEDDGEEGEGGDAPTPSHYNAPKTEEELARIESEAGADSADGEEDSEVAQSADGDLAKLRKDDLVALAAQRGVEIDPGATKDQIVQALQAQ